LAGGGPDRVTTPRSAAIGAHSSTSDAAPATLALRARVSGNGAVSALGLLFGDHSARVSFFSGGSEDWLNRYKIMIFP
jgi:hypothetical protein